MSIERKTLILERLTSDNFGLLQVGAEVGSETFYDGTGTRSDVLAIFLDIFGESFDTHRVYSPVFAEIPGVSERDGSWPTFDARAFVDAGWNGRPIGVGFEYFKPHLKYALWLYFQPTPFWRLALTKAAAGKETSISSRFMSAVDPAFVELLPKRVVSTGLIPDYSTDLPRRLSYPPEVLPRFRQWARAWLIGVPASHHIVRSTSDRFSPIAVAHEVGGVPEADLDVKPDLDEKQHPQALIAWARRAYDATVLRRGQSSVLPRARGRTEIFGNLDCDLDDVADSEDHASTHSFRSARMTHYGYVATPYGQAADQSGTVSFLCSCTGSLKVDSASLSYQSAPRIGSSATAGSSSKGVAIGDYLQTTDPALSRPCQYGTLARGMRLGVRASVSTALHQFGHLFMRELLHRDRHLLTPQGATKEPHGDQTSEDLIFLRDDGSAYGRAAVTISADSTELNERLSATSFSYVRQAVLRQGKFAFIGKTVRKALEPINHVNLFGVFDLALASVDTGFSEQQSSSFLSLLQPSTDKAAIDDQEGVLIWAINAYHRFDANDRDLILENTDLPDFGQSPSTPLPEPHLVLRTVRLFSEASNLAPGGSFGVPGLRPLFASPGSNVALRNRREFEACTFERYSNARAIFWDRVWIASALLHVPVTPEGPHFPIRLGGRWERIVSEPGFRYVPDDDPSRLLAGGLHAFQFTDIADMPLIELAFRNMVAAFGVTFSKAHIYGPALGDTFAKSRARVDGCQIVSTGPNDKSHKKTVIRTSFVTRTGATQNQTEFFVDGNVVDSDVAFGPDGEVGLLLTRDGGVAPLFAWLGAGEAYFNPPSIRLLVDDIVTLDKLHVSLHFSEIVKCGFLSGPVRFRTRETGCDLLYLADANGRCNIYYDKGAYTHEADDGSMHLRPIFDNPLVFGPVSHVDMCVVEEVDPLAVASHGNFDGATGDELERVPRSWPLALVSHPVSASSVDVTIELIELPSTDNLRNIAIQNLLGLGNRLTFVPPEQSVDDFHAVKLVRTEWVQPISSSGKILLRVGPARSRPILDQGDQSSNGTHLSKGLVMPVVIAAQTPEGVRVLYAAYGLHHGVFGVFRERLLPNMKLLDCAVGLHSAQLLCCDLSSARYLSHECMFPPSVRDGHPYSPWIYGASGADVGDRGVDSKARLDLCTEEVDTVDALCAGADAEPPGPPTKLWSWHPEEEWLWMTHELPGNLTSTLHAGTVAACPVLRHPPTTGDSVTFIYSASQIRAFSTEGGFAGLVDYREDQHSFSFEMGESIADEETHQFRYGGDSRFESARTQRPPWWKT